MNMARFIHHNNKHTYTKTFLLLSCLGLIGAAIILHVIWASSSYSSAYLSIASKWAIEKSRFIVVPNVNATNVGQVHVLFLLLYCICQWHFLYVDFNVIFFFLLLWSRIYEPESCVIFILRHVWLLIQGNETIMPLS